MSVDAVRQAIKHYHQQLNLPALKAVHVWSDCGKHFRCAEFAHFVLCEVHGMMAKDAEITLNFFAQKHGKSRRDQFFRQVRQYLDNFCAKAEMRCAADVVKGVIAGHKAVLETGKFVSRKTPEVFVYHMTPPSSGTYTQRLLGLEHIESYHCFRKTGKKFFVHANSCTRECVDLNGFLLP